MEDTYKHNHKLGEDWATELNHGSYGLNGTPTFEEFVKMTDGERTSCPLKGIATPVFGALMSIGHPKHLTVVYRNSYRASNSLDEEELISWRDFENAIS
eukprot:scaffold5539_cov81-Skeletonema_menzelii.AAC.20